MYTCRMQHYSGWRNVENKKHLQYVGKTINFDPDIGENLVDFFQKSPRRIRAVPSLTASKRKEAPTYLDHVEADNFHKKCSGDNE